MDIKPFIPDYDTPSSYGDQPDSHSTSVSTSDQPDSHTTSVSTSDQPDSHTTSVSTNDQSDSHTTSVSTNDQSDSHTTSVSTNDQPDSHTTSVSTNDQSDSHTTSVSTNDQPDSHTTSVSTNDQPDSHTTNSVSQESQQFMSEGKQTDMCFMGERSECEDDEAVKQWDCDEGEQAPDLNTDSDVQTNQTCLSPTDKNDYCVQNCTECVRNIESSHSAHVNSDTPTKDTDLALQSAHLGMDKQSKLQLAEWIQQPPAPSLSVRFTDHAKEQLAEFSAISQEPNYRFRYLNDTDEARNAICSILREDPRSVYRRNHCRDNLYYFAVDALHATCWFDENFVEVVRIRPVALVDHCKEKYHTWNIVFDHFVGEIALVKHNSMKLGTDIATLGVLDFMVKSHWY